MNEDLGNVITLLTGVTAEVNTTRKYIVELATKSANLRDEVDTLWALIDVLLERVSALENKQDLSD